MTYTNKQIILIRDQPDALYYWGRLGAALLTIRIRQLCKSSFHTSPVSKTLNYKVAYMHICSPHSSRLSLSSCLQIVKINPFRVIKQRYTVDILEIIIPFCIIYLGCNASLADGDIAGLSASILLLYKTTPETVFNGVSGQEFQITRSHSDKPELHSDMEKAPSGCISNCSF